MKLSDNSGFPLNYKEKCSYINLDIETCSTPYPILSKSNLAVNLDL